MFQLNFHTDSDSICYRNTSRTTGHEIRLKKVATNLHFP